MGNTTSLPASCPSSENSGGGNPPSQSCGTCCGAQKKTANQQSGVVSYIQGNAGPVSATYYYTPDGSVNQFAVGFQPTSTEWSASGGACGVSANPGSNVGGVVGGYGSGITASSGVGVEASFSQNASGSMGCLGATTGTPGASPTMSYSMSPSDWVSTLTPTQTILPSNEVAFDQYGEAYQSNTGSLQDDAEDSLR